VATAIYDRFVESLMATTQIIIPQSFISSMTQLMQQMQQMQRITTQFIQASQQIHIPVQQAQVAQTQVIGRMNKMLQLLRRIEAAFAKSIDSIVNAMGTIGQTFLRGLAVTAEIAGPIIAAGAIIVGAAFSAAMYSARFARWIWNKMVDLGDSMLQDWLLSSGMMATVGGVRSYRTAFGMLPDQQIISQMPKARGYAASQQAIALGILGVKNFRNSADMMVQATLAAAKFMKKQQKGQELKMAEASALTSLFSPRDLLALREMDEKELAERAKLYEANKGKLEISEGARHGWINFSIQVKVMWARIQTAVAEGMADPRSNFMQSFNQLSKSIVKFIRTIMNSPLVERIFNWLARQIDRFADKLNGDETTSEIKNIVNTVGDILTLIGRIINTLARLGASLTMPDKPTLLSQKYPGRARFMEHIGMRGEPRGPFGIIPGARYQRPAYAPSEVIPAPISRYPGRAEFTKRIGIARPEGAPEISPRPAPISRYPGRARFVEKIGVARPPGAEKISPRPVRQGSSGVRQGSSGERQGSSGVRQGSSGQRQVPTGDIKAPTGQLRGGQVNSSDLYNSYKEKFKNSPLNGYVPKDGARWGIKTGSPDEWARLATATSKQESGLNANERGGGLNQFEVGDLRRYGVSGNVNDPNAQTDALVNQWSSSIKKDGVISQPAPGNPGPGNDWLGAGRYFGSMRDKGWHGKTQADVDKHLAPGGWADRAQQSASGSTSSVTGPPSGAAPQPIRSGDTSDLPPAMNAATGQAPDAFIVHHTGGRGTAESVQDTLRQRGLGVEYVMERDGSIRQIGGPGAANIMNESRYRQTPILGQGKPFLTNRNIVGMEVIAKDDKDVTPAQRDAARRFIQERYPNTPVFGHGEVNPGHKEADEGKTITDAVRNDRANAAAATKADDNRVDASGAATSGDRDRIYIGRNPIPGSTAPYSESTFQPAQKAPFQGAQENEAQDNPANNVKIDNRSDMDISQAKTHSDNDTGSLHPVEEMKKESDGGGGGADAAPSGDDGGGDGSE
jgi:hypothetical protein